MYDDIKPPSRNLPRIAVRTMPLEVNTSKHSRAVFQTPEQIADADNEAQPISSKDTTTESSIKKTAKKHTLKLKVWLKNLSKKQWLLIGAIGIVLILGGGGSVYALIHHKKTVPPAAHVQTSQKITPPAPTLVPSTLSGLPVAPVINQRTVTGVMIENSPDARPQSALNQASVVFEAVAEAGITRFLALFQDTQPDYIGPVRSARPYYLQWALGFDAALAHVGGSPEALNDIKAWGVKDLDEFANGNFYQRVPSRYAPHNVYTSTVQLNQLEINKNFGASHFDGFPRKLDSPTKTPAASSIDVAISSFYYNAHFQYVPATNTYNRSEGGQPHIDLKSGQQISPKVVIVLIMQKGIEADDLHTSYTTIGSGQAYVFQDGLVTTGIWQKTGSASQITFSDSSSKPIKLNAGQTWISVIGAAANVSYKP